MKDKYSTYVQPRLVEIMDWTRAGAGLKEIAQRLGVGETSLRGWARKGREGEERYVPLAVVLDRAGEEPSQTVEAALFKRAVGYQFEEVTREEKLDRDGNIHVLTKTVTKDEPPHLTSIMYFLSNRLPSRWSRETGPANGNEDPTGVVELPAARKPTSPKEKSEG